MASLFKDPSRPKKIKLRSSQSARPHFTIQKSLGMEDIRDEESVKASMPAEPSASFKYSSRSRTPPPSVKPFCGEDTEYMAYISIFLVEVAKDGDGSELPKRGKSMKDTHNEGEFIPPQTNKGTSLEVPKLVEGLSASLTSEDNKAIASAYVDGADSIFLEVSNTDLDRHRDQEVTKIPKEPSIMCGGVFNGPNFGNGGDCKRIDIQTSELVGGFWINKKFVSLYKKIWCKYGHIATQKVLRTSMVALVALVEDLLETISVMTTLRFSDLTSVMLASWDAQIADVEALLFNVAWLRACFEEIKKKWETITLLKAAPLDSDEQALQLAMDQRKDLCTNLETLRSQVSKIEDELTTVDAEIAQHKVKVEEAAIAREEYLSFMQNTVLEI